MSQIVVNKKGLKLAVDLHRPQGKGPFPLVIVMNGYTAPKDRNHIVSLADALAGAGIGALRFDASGFGRSEGTITEDYRFTNCYKDLTTVYEYAKTLDWVAADRIGVWGQSMGGMLAIIWAADHSELKAVCNCEGPHRMDRNGEKERAERLTSGESKTIWSYALNREEDIFVPPAFFEDVYNYDASVSAKKLAVPSLTVIGLADDIVIPEHVRAVYDAIPGKKALLEIPGMTHRYRDQPEILAAVNAKMVAFFKEHL